MVAAGLQEKFSWKSVAAAAVSAAVSNQISTSIQGAPIRDGAGRLETGADGQILRANTAFANYNAGAARVTSDFISGITGAYIRHGITNSPINFKDAAAESLGNTLANEIVGGLIREEQTSKRLAEQVSLTNGPAREPSFRLNRQSALAFSDATDDLIVNESRRLVAFNNAVSDPLATQVTDGDEIVRAGDGSDPSLAVRVADTSSGRRIQSELNRQKPTGPTISVSRGPSFLDSLSIIWSGTNPGLANIGDSASALYQAAESYFVQDVKRKSYENNAQILQELEGDKSLGGMRAREAIMYSQAFLDLVPTNGFEAAAMFAGIRLPGLSATGSRVVRGVDSIGDVANSAIGRNLWNLVEPIRPANYGIAPSKLKEFFNPGIDTYQPGTIFYQAQRFGQRGVGEFFSTGRPVDALDAEIMFDISRFGNNAQQLATYRLVSPGEFLNGGVAGGTGAQIWIPKDISGQFLERIGIEPLFVPALKVKAK